MTDTSGMIIDPFDPHRAITPPGRLAAQLYILARPIPPGEPLTQADIDEATFIGHIDPVWQGAAPGGTP